MRAANRNFPGFLAASAAVIVPLASLFIIFFFAVPGRAAAYAVGPVPPSGQASGTSVGQGYDFTNSFENLVSSFTSFFDHIKSSNGAVAISGNSAGVSDAVPPGVTVTVDWQSYLNRFDAWFYGVTGVNIGWLTDLIVRFFSWLFGVLQEIVVWLAGFLTGALRQTGT